MSDHSIYEYAGTLAEDKLAQIEALAVVGAAATHSNLVIHETFRRGFFEVIARLAYEAQADAMASADVTLRKADKHPEAVQDVANETPR